MANVNTPPPASNRATRRAKRAQQSKWKPELQKILARHNGMHGTRNKIVSNSTIEARSEGLSRMFSLIRAFGFRIAPADLGGRHVESLMRYWTADPGVAADLAFRGVKNLPPLSKPLSAAYIQQQMSFLRVFSEWIGKPGLVKPADQYVKDAELVKRHSNAERDKSWTGNDCSFDEVLAAVRARDEFVAGQLEMMMSFGLRRKEAVMFSPFRAEVPDYAVPPGQGNTERYIAFLRVKRGTKGGRLRYVAIRNPRQEQALQHARLLARNTGHIGRPGLTLKQSLDRFSNVLRKVGVTRKLLGVTSHGLRHEFASDLYFEVSGTVSPVRGGTGVANADLVDAAIQEVVRQLGHERPQIAGAYLGSPARLKQ